VLRSARETVIVCAALAFAGIAGAQEVELPSAKQRWIEVRTENFRFFSNAGKSSTKRVAVDLEELREVFAQLTDYELQSPIPTLIYIFKSEKSFKPYKILYQGNPASVAGYFAARPQANFIAVTAGSREGSGIVFHEYVHYLAANNLWYLPLWFSEGLAQLYETFEVFQDRVYIGLPIPRHVLWLRRSTPIPLEELFSVNHISPMYNERSRQGSFYAQSWALVHYLLLGNEERRVQLDRYLALIRNGFPEPTAFSRAFETDYETLERELRTYLRLTNFPYIETTTEIDVDRSFNVREMSHSEVLFRLGDLLANQDPPRPESRSYFEAAIEADPANGAALSALAIEAESRADWAVAAAFHQRALEASPSDHLIVFRAGQFARVRGSDTSTAIEILTRSTELDPGFAPAWAALARTYAEAAITSDEAVRSAETAHRLLPSDLNVALDLLRLYLRLDLRESALVVVEDSLGSNPGVQAQGRMLLLQKDFVQVREYIRVGDLEAAENRMVLADSLAQRMTADESTQRNLYNTRLLISEHKAAALYDQAELHYQRGDTETAKNLLEEALHERSEGAVAAACRRLLDVINHPDQYRFNPVPVVESSPTEEELERLNRLFAANDLSGALDFLNEMRLRSVGQQQRWIMRKIDEVEKNILHNRFVDEYNRAIDLYNRRHYDAVIQIVEEMLNWLPEGPEALASRDLRKDARAALENSRR
jgi:tetratricopeptide (TPR) repeat protein